MSRHSLDPGWRHGGGCLQRNLEIRSSTLRAGTRHGDDESLLHIRKKRGSLSSAYSVSDPRVLGWHICRLLPDTAGTPCNTPASANYIIPEDIDNTLHCTAKPPVLSAIGFACDKATPCACAMAVLTACVAPLRLHAVHRCPTVAACHRDTTGLTAKRYILCAANLPVLKVPTSLPLNRPCPGVILPCCRPPSGSESVYEGEAATRVDQHRYIRVEDRRS